MARHLPSSDEQSEETTGENSAQEEQCGSEETNDEKEKTQTQKTQSLKDSEEPSSSDDNSTSPTTTGFNMKPSSSKKPPATKKPSATEAKPATKRLAKKQSNVKDGQRKRIEVDDGGYAVEEKKPPVNRIYSEEDEVVIVKGILDFKTKKGSDAFEDQNGFYEFVKKDLSVNVSKEQLMDKARKLRKKYRDYAEKSLKGEDAVFRNPCEHKCFQLWQKILHADESDTLEAVETVAKSGTKAKRSVEAFNKSATMKKGEDSDVHHSGGYAKKKKKPLNPEEDLVEDNEDHEEDFFSKFPKLEWSLETDNMYPSMPQAVMCFMKELLPKIGHKRGKELEEKWKIFCGEQIRLYLKQLDLVREQTQLILDAMEAEES